MLTGLSDIASSYDALICDVWGVLHNGRTVHPHAADALRRFRQNHGPVVMLTNAPRSPQDVRGQFAKFGVPDDCFDAIVSSGGAAHDELALRAAPRAPGDPLRVHCVAGEGDLSILHGLNVRQTDVAEAEVVLLVGLRQDEVETPADYAGELAAMRARDLTVLCANPDIVVHRGPNLAWCAGALARDYEKLGGNAIYYGKPHAPVYDAARAAAGGAKRPLAIGDGMFTDIKGANGQGMDVLFIADGIHGEEIEPYNQTHIAQLLGGAGLHAVAALRSLKW